MRAALLTRHGEPPELADRPALQPVDGHALVRTTAAPITPLDILCATGTSYFGPPALPYAPGVQGVGVVEHSATLATGTSVWFPTSAGMAPGDGSMAEQVLVADSDLVAAPAGVEDTLVAALGLSAVAAWMALTWRAELRPGEQVLVLGGGGVVGQVAVQAARLLGARRVVAACRSRTAQERARDRGADAVVELGDEDTADELVDRLAASCDGEVDVVIDPLCGLSATAALRLLAPRGRLVNLGSSAGATATFASADLRSKTAAVLGYTNNGVTSAQKAQALTEVLEHAAAGRLTVAHECVRFDQLPEAWARQAAGQADRRIVVTLD
ncbi:MAG TPA: zinc-binding dehydrogenase [Nocardioidaceae bacterium]|nr:zinc-binding dehydrogenase [Nocardioidaceae bacterium]